jgi:hypothetical protein
MGSGCIYPPIIDLGTSWMLHVTVLCYYYYFTVTVVKASISFVFNDLAKLKYTITKTNLYAIHGHTLHFLLSNR